jgi:hypothetical protein
MGMIFSNPAQFEVLVLFSIGAVGLACVLFWVWAASKREHPLMVRMLERGRALKAKGGAKEQEKEKEKEGMEMAREMEVRNEGGHDEASAVKENADDAYDDL